MEVGTRMTPQQHLYLIFDDWKVGYSFRMVDLSEPGWLVPGGKLLGDIARETATTLPRSFFRLEAKRGMPWHFTAIGSKILAMPPSQEKDNFDKGGTCLDVLMRGVTFIPRHMDVHRPIYFHMGSRLFVLGSSSFQCIDLLLLEGPRRQQLLWRNLLKPPFNSSYVVAHAIHPEQNIILVSVGLLVPDATYSFHMTEDGGLDWKHVGNWILPFQGRAYFDRKLNTWVGLSMHRNHRGHIFSCQLELALTGHCPDVKYSDEYLFSRDLGESHRGANLICMGGESKYCLVESVAVDYYKRAEDYMFKQESSFFRYMFRVTKFSLEYNENGNIITAHSRFRYYFAPKNQVTRFACQFPVAFFM